jgi:leucyl-tRNA synthetase
MSTPAHIPGPLPEAYAPEPLEAHWQTAWKQAECFAAPQDPGDAPPVYVLEMFPYPSGDLHMGHVRNYCIGDVFARFARLQGACVLHPMGWDALGLPAENQAILEQVAPQERTPKNIARMRQQLVRLGLAYDWKREIATYLPEYYRWNQWFFLELYKRDLVYRRKATVNFCPGCDTVIANEQVGDDQVCWRGHPGVTPRSIDEWSFRITAYAEALLEGLDGLDAWPERIRAQQRHWLGKSTGATVRFASPDAKFSLEVFTTRIDTLMGCTAVLVAPEHPLLQAQVPPAQRAAVEDFAARVQRLDRALRIADQAPRDGVFSGLTVLHPLTQAPLPVIAANYVLADYGSGAVMCVPAHDSRDHALAKAIDLPICQVVVGNDPQAPLPLTERGHLVNSGAYDGLDSTTAQQRLTAEAEQKGFGAAKVTWHLRDWGFSRQRYWGTPIPIVYCDSCGTVPLPHSALPVRLPNFADLKLTGTGGAPLKQVESFWKVDCPSCGKAAKREVDTMDTFVDSAWYFARYLSPQRTEGPVDPQAARTWLPVDVYVGGPEHAVMHLLYFRFFTRVMRELGLCEVDEPVKRLITQGMVNAPAYRCAQHGYQPAASFRDLPAGAGGAGAAASAAACTHCAKPLQVGIEKMSKSKLNGVDPLALIARYGADTTRLYTLFAAPPEKDLEWDPNGVEGIYRFVCRLWRLMLPATGGAGGAQAAAPASSAAAATGAAADKSTGASKSTGPSQTPSSAADDAAARRAVHHTLQRVTDELRSRNHFNTAIAALMEMVNALYGLGMHAAGSSVSPGVRQEILRLTALMLAPLAPHLAESCWQVAGGDGLVATARWPQVDASALVQQSIRLAVQINGKLRAQIEVPPDADAATAAAVARADANVIRHLGNRPVLKQIYVPKRLLNFVVPRDVS